jgi:hypothetical protein
MSITLKILVIKGSLDLGPDLNLTALQIHLQISTPLGVFIVTLLGMYRESVGKGAMIWLGVGTFLTSIKIVFHEG